MISNLHTIGTSYCHSRMFAVDQETFDMFQNVYEFKRAMLSLTHRTTV